MIDKDKTYRTRDGREVRIYATDAGGKYPVHGSVKDGDHWAICSWMADGRCTMIGEHYTDLIEVKPRIQLDVWINVYEDGTHGFKEKEKADSLREPDCIACVKVTIDVEHGHGLEGDAQ